MLTLTAVFAVHATALAAVLLAARNSVLVDDAGRPLDRSSAWQEHVVPAVRTADSLVH